MCKKLLCLLMLVFVIGGGAIVEADPNLVCWWEMDQSSGTTVTDTQGNMNGTMGNNNYWDSNSLYFTGENYGVSGVSCDESIFSGISNQITFAFWAKIDVETTVENGYFFTAKVSGTRVFQIDLSGDASKSVAYKGVSSEWCSVSDIWTPGSSVDPEEFNHYAFTKNATTGEMNLYVNGLLKSMTDDATATFANIDLFEICGTSSNWHQWAGNVKDFRIYDRALSDSEIEVLATPDYSSDYAHSPAPGDDADWPYYSTSDVTLGWEAGDNAASHDVYFGTNYSSVANADNESPEFMDNVEVTDYYVDNMSADSTYYWRVDEVNGENTWTGDVWSFYTEDDWGKEGWILTFHDEFNTGSAPDNTKWSLTRSYVSVESPMAFPADPNLAVISGGTLSLLTVKEDYEDPYAGWKEYCSGKIKSAHRFEQAYGRFEARCKIPNTGGAFPAFWLMPYGDTYWPRAEIDIMEYVDGDGEYTSSNLHWNDYGEEHESWGTQYVAVSNLWTEFHVFAIEWEPGEMRFYVDGNNHCTYYDPDPPSDMNVPTAKEYIILNNALAQWGSPINDNDLPSVFEVDYVRVYEAGATPPPPPPLPGKATNPSPYNDQTQVSRSADLSWTAGADATTHLVYFGTDTTPDETEYKGEQAGTTYDPGYLVARTRYYWRIDEKNASGVTTGDIWNFRTGNNQNHISK